MYMNLDHNITITPSRSAIGEEPGISRGFSGDSQGYLFSFYFRYVWFLVSQIASIHIDKGTIKLLGPPSSINTGPLPSFFISSCIISPGSSEAARQRVRLRLSIHPGCICPSLCHAYNPRWRPEVAVSAVSPSETLAVYPIYAYMLVSCFGWKELLHICLIDASFV
jgi:hypothetical protein